MGIFNRKKAEEALAKAKQEKEKEAKFREEMAQYGLKEEDFIEDESSQRPSPKTEDIAAAVAKAVRDALASPSEDKKEADVPHVEQ